jgi:glycine cleavage system aminomethyltransferase T
VHGEDVFEIWVKTKDGEVFMFMLFEASWMVIEV